MKINSENLYELINDGTIKVGTKLKAYKDDVYLTQIIFDGYDFQWQSGTFTSGDLFNPLVDFEIIEEEKEIKNINLGYVVCKSDFADLHIVDLLNNFFKENDEKINELVRELNKIKKEGKQL